MHNENLTDAAKKAMTAQETDEVLLTLLTIKYNGEPILRVVNNKEAVTSNGNDFIPCGFSVSLPDQSADGNNPCRLQIDNADISIYKIIKSAAIQSLREKREISCTAAVIMASEPDNCVEGPLNFILRNINADINVITGELYDSYMHDKNFTILTYNPNDFPGLFF